MTYRNPLPPMADMIRAEATEQADLTKDGMATAVTGHRVHVIRAAFTTHRVAYCGTRLPTGWPAHGAPQHAIPDCARCYS